MDLRKQKQGTSPSAGNNIQFYKGLKQKYVNLRKLRPGTSPSAGNNIHIYKGLKQK